MKRLGKNGFFGIKNVFFLQKYFAQKDEKSRLFWLYVKVQYG